MLVEPLMLGAETGGDISLVLGTSLFSLLEPSFILCVNALQGVTDQAARRRPLCAIGIVEIFEIAASIAVFCLRCTFVLLLRLQ